MGEQGEDMGEQVEVEMKVRFLIDKAKATILYMEAGKDLVDMLFGFLQLPVATVLTLFSDNDMPLKVGCMSSIYESLQNLSKASFVVSKDTIMHPPCAFKLSKSSPQLLLPAELPAPSKFPSLPTKVFRCDFCRKIESVSWATGVYCNHCLKTMSSPVSLKGDPPPVIMPSTAATEGYVQHYLSFIVTNELSILPASTIESIVLLNKLKVEKVSDLDSFESVVTASEALELLKVSFTSREALNNVFGAKLPGPSKKASP